MSADRNHLFRAFALLWGRLGSARIYVAAIAVAMFILAALGLWHLVAPPKPIKSSTNNVPVTKATSPAATALARVSPSVEHSPSPTALQKEIALTDVTQEERRGPRGETLVVATIGITSRTDVEKENVEIRIFFYDLAPNNEMRPTNAQVTYQWITPVRDWSDPRPKYLAATYLKRRPFWRAPDRLGYGGFVVRVYSNGKLQDERSKPESLSAQLRSNAPPSPAAPTSDLRPQTSAIPSIPPSSFRPPPSTTPSPVTDHSPEDLPKGIPIPGKPGFVQSPYDPKFTIDVRGFPPGTLVNDPNTNKPFRVP